MKIAVAGTGYVGLSLAVLLSRYNDVVAVDLIEEKVEKINNKISPIKDEYVENNDVEIIEDTKEEPEVVLETLEEPEEQDKEEEKEEDKLSEEEKQKLEEERKKKEEQNKI